MKSSSPIFLLKETAKEFARNKPLLMGAAISFYIILSMGPILVISILAIGSFLGEQAVKGQLVEEINRSVGEKLSQVLNYLILKAYQFPSKSAAILSSIPLIFFGCTMIFYQIKTSLDIIFETEDENGNSFLERIKNYSFSFLMLLVVGAVLFLLVIKSPLIDLLRENIENFLPIHQLLYRVIDFLFSFTIISILFSLIYKILPEKKLTWKECLIGGVVTSFFFTIVQVLVSINIKVSEVESAFGALGSYTILILWIFYSSLIFLFGANFTKVYHKLKNQ
jgi:membrane protein